VIEAKAADPAARTARRLEELCRLLEIAVGEPVRLARGTAGAGRIAPVPGWTLEARWPEERLGAAAELLRRLAAAEAESESLCSEILERYEEATLVQRVARRLATAVGQSSIAGLLVDEAVRTLGASSGELWLVEDGAAALAAAVPPLASESWDLKEQGPLSALRDGRAWSREASLGCESVVAVPLPGPTEDPLGVLVLRGRSGGRSYRSAEVKLLGSLACLASAFLRSDRAASRNQVAPSSLERDSLAAAVCSLLAPTGDLVAPGLEVAAHAGSEARDGFDAFDLRPVPDGTVALWTAHAQPGGIGAALAVAALRAVLHTETWRGSDPESVLEYARGMLSADLERSGHLTGAFLGSIDDARTRMDYMNAGHPGPLLVRSDGTSERLDAGAPALGAAAAQGSGLGSCPLRSGDVLVVASTNPADVRDPSGGRFRIERVADVVRERLAQPVTAILDNLRRELGAHRGTPAGGDELTLLVVRILPPQGDRRPTT
jgi:hypothetical protein